LKKNKAILTLIVIAVLFSCNKKEEVTLDYLGYIPIVEGQYRTYQVRYIDFKSFSEDSDSSEYYEKEVVESFFIDNEGDSSFRVAVFHSAQSEGPWKFQYYFMISRTEAAYEVTRNNQRRIKLVFPVKELRSWDENEFNTKEFRLNKYRNVGKASPVSGLTFDNTLEVDGGLIKDPVLHSFRYSVYAYDIGLIYEEDIYKQTQNKKTEGFESERILVDYSH
jgi:hypothetical protein